MGDLNGLDQIPGIAALKDVGIWKNGEITSLGKTFGADPKHWRADMSFTALSCLYSSKIVGLIQRADDDYADCNLLQNERQGKHMYFAGLATIQLQLKSLQPIAVQMLTTAMNFIKRFNIRADKNVLNALMSFYTFLSNIKDGVNELMEDLFRIFINMKLYTRYLIETFAVLNCSWSAFDVDRLHQADGGFPDEILNEFNLPETHFQSEHLDPRNLVLPNIWEIKIDHEHYSEKMITMGYMRVKSDHTDSFLKAYAVVRLVEDGRSEIITQSQTVAFQCIVSVIFYFISRITERSARSKTTINKATETDMDNALTFLKGLNFPGSLHAKLRKLLYQRMVNSNKPVKYLFEGSQLTEDAIEKIIAEDKTRNAEAMTNTLNQFSNALLAMQPDIKTSIEVNKMLCDYEFEEVGFLQYDTSKLQINHSLLSERESTRPKIPILNSLKDKNCGFSNVAVVHFILIDYIISQCEAMFDLNNMDTDTQLESWFDSLIRSIRSIRGVLDHSLVTTLDTLKSTYPHNNGNRKLIDSILAMKLYLSNGNLFDSRAPITVSKLDALKRYNRFVINLIEHYTVHSCPRRSPREKFTKEILANIDRQCSSDVGRNDKTKLIKCVEGIIRDNLKTYQAVPSGSQTDRNDYTIEKLLMTEILERALNRDYSLSMLLELNVSWEGEHKKITEIVDVARNNINPKYLGKYQLVVIKAIVFIVYEYMKMILQSSSASSNNFRQYCSKMDVLLNALNIIGSDFLPLALYRNYQMIVENVQEYFRGDALVNTSALIGTIEAEQYYLGIQKGSSSAIAQGIVLSIPDHTLRPISKSTDVEAAGSSASKMDGDYILHQLLWYMTAVDEIRTNLANVALVLDLKRMSNLQI